MTNQEIIIAVAKLDGYAIHYCPDGSPHKMEKEGDFIWFTETGISGKDYLTSRDAIIPVIEKQRQNIRHEIYRILWRQFDNLSLAESVDVVFLATPEQLTDALLKATGNYSP